MSRYRNARPAPVHSMTLANAGKTPLAWRLLACVATMSLMAACASVGPPAPATLDQPGQHLMRYHGPRLEVVVSSRFAASSLGEPWLMLNVSMTGTRRVAARVSRDGLFVIAPSGERIAAPTQREFAEAFPEVQSLIHRAALASEPLSYAGGDKERCRLAFFATPGVAIRRPGDAHTSDLLFVNNRMLCSGPLYFPIPGGVQPGTWVLGIQLDEITIRIPFALERSSR